MKSKPLRVALTGWGGLDNPEPGLAVARALRDHWNGPLDILGLVYDTWTTGAWTPGVANSVHIIPTIANGDYAALMRILHIHKEQPIDVLLPCLDLEVPLYARLAKRLLREGIRTLLPDPDDSFKITKPQLYWFCYSNQIVTPKTTHVLDISSVALHADLFGYPLWVKGTVAGAKRVYNAGQAAYEASLLAAKWGGGVLLQEAIEGSEHVVSMVAREDGSCLAMTMMRKIGLNARGKGMVGSVVEDPSLRKLALHILSKLNWRGPLELEFVRSQSNGQFYLLEVNCRFPSWIYLTALAGANQPMALVKEILEPGSRAPKQAQIGAMYARDVQEMVVPASSIVKLARTGSADVPAPAIVKSRRGDVSVAVTGISALELTQPGLGVVRSLRAAPEVAKVIGLGYASTDTGLFRKEIFDVCARMPIDENEDKPERCDEATLNRLLAIQKAHGLDMVIPNLDVEIARYQRLSGELRSHGIHTLLPTPEATDKLSKQGLIKLSNRNAQVDFDFPPTVVVSSKKDLQAAWKRFGSPMMIKGMDSLATKVFSLAQAELAFSRYKEFGENKIIVQAVVFGEEFSIGVVCDSSSDLFDALPLKKTVMCERGKTWSGIKVDMPDVMQRLAVLLKKVGWQGPADVELIRDITTDRMILIEVNPRFPAWIGYGQLVNSNLPRQLMLKALGREPLPMPKAPALDKDLVFLRTAQEIPASASAMAMFINRGEIRHASSR